MKLLRALPLALVLATAPALADVVPPDVDACNGRAVGAACGGGMTGVPAGTCRNATYTRIDYAGWNRDAMATPPTMQYPCVRCEGGAADAGADAGTATPPATSSDNGCAVGSTVGRRVGPWALAGLVWVVLLGRRRRA